MLVGRYQWLRYAFTVWTLNTIWSGSAGVYVFARQTQAGYFALYVGETSSFSDRFASHEHWNQAVQLGMTHVHTREVANRTERLRLERQLVNALSPPLNG